MSNPNYDEFVDTRSRADLIGDIPKHGKGGRPPKNPLIAPKMKPPTLSAEKNLKDRAKKLIADYVEQQILNLVQLSQSAESETVRADCSKFLVQQFMGKPAVVHTGQDGVPLLPNIIIMSGNQPPATLLDASQYIVADDDE